MIGRRFASCCHSGHDFHGYFQPISVSPSCNLLSIYSLQSCLTLNPIAQNHTQPCLQSPLAPRYRHAYHHLPAYDALVSAQLCHLLTCPLHFLTPSTLSQSLILEILVLYLLQANSLPPAACGPE